MRRCFPALEAPSLHGETEVSTVINTVEVEAEMRFLSPKAQPDDTKALLRLLLSRFSRVRLCATP